MDYSQRSLDHPIFSRWAYLPSLIRWLFPLLLVLTGWTSHAAAQQNLQFAAVAPIVKPKLTLTVSPKRVTEGNSVNFGLTWNMDASNLKILYKLLLNGKEVGDWRNDRSYTYRFNQAGTYQAEVTAYALFTTGQAVQQQLISRSNIVSVAVDPTYKLSVRITPSDMSVRAGEAAIFVAEVRPEVPVRYRWRGPTQQSSKSQTFRIDTEGLSSGHQYAVEVEVVDDHKQFARHQAQLNITPTHPLRVEIMPSQYQLLLGDKMHFKAVVNGTESTRYTYHWIGPGDRKTTSDTFTVIANSALIGSHEIKLLVKDDLGRSATAEASLDIVAPVLSLRRESDRTINAGGVVVFWGEVMPDAPVENLRLHIGAGETERPIELNKPYPINFDTPGDYQVYLTGQLVNLSLESQSQHVRVVRSPAPWLLWGGLGLVIFGGLGWWLKKRFKKPAPLEARISVVVNPNFSQWQGGFEHTVESDLGIRLALIVDLGEQTWNIKTDSLT